MLSTVEDVQYCWGCSVLMRMFSTDEDVQGGCSVLLGMLSTVEDVQYC